MGPKFLGLPYCYGVALGSCSRLGFDLSQQIEGKLPPVHSPLDLVWVATIVPTALLLHCCCALGTAALWALWLNQA